MPVQHTRALLAAALDGSLTNPESREGPVFGLRVPTAIAGIPSKILTPRSTWSDAAAYVWFVEAVDVADPGRDALPHVRVERWNTPLAHQVVDRSPLSERPRQRPRQAHIRPLGSGKWRVWSSDSSRRICARSCGSAKG